MRNNSTIVPTIRLTAAAKTRLPLAVQQHMLRLYLKAYASGQLLNDPVMAKKGHDARMDGWIIDPTQGGRFPEKGLAGAPPKPQPGQSVMTALPREYAPPPPKKKPGIGPPAYVHRLRSQTDLAGQVEEYAPHAVMEPAILSEDASNYYQQQLDQNRTNEKKHGVSLASTLNKIGYGVPKVLTDLAPGYRTMADIPWQLMEGAYTGEIGSLLSPFVSLANRQLSTGKPINPTVAWLAHTGLNEQAASHEHLVGHGPKPGEVADPGFFEQHQGSYLQDVSEILSGWASPLDKENWKTDPVGTSLTTYEEIAPFLKFLLPKVTVGTMKRSLDAKASGNKVGAARWRGMAVNSDKANRIVNPVETPEGYIDHLMKEALKESYKRFTERPTTTDHYTYKPIGRFYYVYKNGKPVMLSPKEPLRYLDLKDAKMYIDKRNPSQKTNYHQATARQAAAAMSPQVQGPTHLHLNKAPVGQTPPFVPRPKPGAAPGAPATKPQSPSVSGAQPMRRAGINPPFGPMAPDSSGQSPTSGQRTQTAYVPVPQGGGRWSMMHTGTLSYLPDPKGNRLYFNSPSEGMQAIARLSPAPSPSIVKPPTAPPFPTGVPSPASPWERQRSGMDIV